MLTDFVKCIQIICDLSILFNIYFTDKFGQKLYTMFVTQQTQLRFENINLMPQTLVQRQKCKLQNNNFIK